jgi:PIN domain nuclease of toxin-antitoxin system
VGGLEVILLDTHAWVWWMSDPTLLSSRAKKAVDAALENGPALVSSISVWEVALLVAKKRLQLTMDVTDWIAKTERVPFIRFVPVDNTIALKSVTLSGLLHDDPADRMIIATAIREGASIVTKDKRIIGYPSVQTIW